MHSKRSGRYMPTGSKVIDNCIVLLPVLATSMLDFDSSLSRKVTYCAWGKSNHTKKKICKAYDFKREDYLIDN